MRSTPGVFEALTSLRFLTARRDAGCSNRFKPLQPVIAANILADARGVHGPLMAVHLARAITSQPARHDRIDPQILAAAERLGVRPSAVQPAQAFAHDPATVAGLMTRDAVGDAKCGAKLERWSVEHTDGQPRARVFFSGRVAASLDDVAGVLDPRGWQGLPNTSFRRSDPLPQRCTDHFPHGSTTLPAASPGQSWVGRLDEQFAYDFSTAEVSYASSISNVLHIEAVRTASSFQVSYWLCKAGAGVFVDGNGPHATDPGLVHDCGFVTATQVTTDETTVTGEKLLEFHDGELARAFADGAVPMMHALVTSTFIDALEPRGRRTWPLEECERDGDAATLPALCTACGNEP